MNAVALDQFTLKLSVACLKQDGGPIAAAEHIAAICACGQMHGTVLIDADGQLTRETAPLWNDKRTRALVDVFSSTVRTPVL